MRVAVIDCGTNTFNLLIVEVDSMSKASKIFNTRISVKLGEGSTTGGHIEPAPYRRGLEAIGVFSEEIKKFEVKKTLAFATAAIREARNGQSFADEILRKYKIHIHIIDGEKEAELIYLGVKEALPLSDSYSLIMDIGGGSTEFIIANKEGIKWKHSFNIGAARLLQKFNPSNPITKTEWSDINNYLKKELTLLKLAVQKWKPIELIGSSGAFDSVIEMIHSELGGEIFTTEKTEYEVNIKNYFRISEQIIKSTLEERKKIKGLVPMRQDMIVISCLMIDFVLKEAGLEAMRVSTYSLKEGALAQCMA